MVSGADAEFSLPCDASISIIVLETCNKADGGDTTAQPANRPDQLPDEAVDASVQPSEPDAVRSIVARAGIEDGDAFLGGRPYRGASGATPEKKSTSSAPISVDASSKSFSLGRS